MSTLIFRKKKLRPPTSCTLCRGGYLETRWWNRKIEGELGGYKKTPPARTPQAMCTLIKYREGPPPPSRADSLVRRSQPLPGTLHRNFARFPSNILPWRPIPSCQWSSPPWQLPSHPCQQPTPIHPSSCAKEQLCHRERDGDLKVSSF